MTEPATGFRTIERQSVVALAVEQIRRMIATGALGPGDRLPSERALSEFFGVSRPSVREAIKALASTGIVEIRQGSGTYVASFTADTMGDALASSVSDSRAALGDLMDVRIWLEVGAVERAAEKITDDEIAELKSLAAEAAQQVDDVQAFVRIDIHFHRMIHQATHNPVLSSLMATVSAMAEQSRLVTAQQRTVRVSTLHEHEEIIAALQGRDPVAAGRAMREHLRHIAPHLEDGDGADGRPD